jgi:hypothetical protein
VAVRSTPSSTTSSPFGPGEGVITPREGDSIVKRSAVGGEGGGEEEVWLGARQAAESRELELE